MRSLVIAVAFAASTIPGVALAATTNATVSVSASVPANCVLATNAAVDFGTYDTAQRAQDGPLDVTAQAVSIACTKDAPNVTIALDRGENARGPHRGMGGPGTATVAYDIYTTPDRATVWDMINTVGYASQGSKPVSIPLYGRIPAGQSVAPGRYSDVLLAMVNF